MRPRRFSVHICASHWSVAITDFHQWVHLILVLALLLRQILNIYASSLIFPYFEVVLCWLKKIFNFLVIYFAHWDLNGILHFFWCVFNPIIDGSNHPGNDTLVLYVIRMRTLHRMGLTRGGLTVGKNGAVESIKNRVYNWSCSNVIYRLLSTWHVKYGIKIEVIHFDVTVFARIIKLHKLLASIEINTAIGAFIDFLFVQGSYTTNYCHISLLLLLLDFIFHRSFQVL